MMDTTDVIFIVDGVDDITIYVPYNETYVFTDEDSTVVT